MNSKIQYWRKRAGKIARLEGVGGTVTFHPRDKASYRIYDRTRVTGSFSPFAKEVLFCIRKYQDRTAMSNLLHELAHVIDFHKRGWLKRKQEHDKVFHKEWTRLRRRYLWK